MATKSPRSAINLGQATYRRLRDVLKERTRPVILWCGAGLSAEVGLPDWNGLKQKLLSDLEEKAHSFDDPERSKILARCATIDDERNGWIAFTQLRRALGPTSFREGVREALTLPPGAVTPRQYIGFWSAGIRGVINLNLDRLATRAYSELHSKMIAEIAGKQISAAPQILGSSKPFILNLHGVLDEVDTWVLTYEGLKQIQKQKAYSTTLSSIFTNFSVLFAGISADDVAAGGYLANLTKEGIDLGAHFWMTSRGDSETDEWSEEAGLQVIRYNSAYGHDMAFDAVFDDLAAYLPKEVEAPAVLSDIVDRTAVILDPADLSSQSPEQIRHAIAGHARHLLEGASTAFPDGYRDFVSRYARPIYNAWYIGLEEPDNIFFGHRIESLIGEGAFSHVYRTTGPDGSQRAIKVMRHEIADDEVMLSCFRRGISSMRILERHRLEGMVQIIDAVELPTAIFMDYIDGPTLETVVESNLIEPWADGLSYLIRVAEIVQEGHRLPERVLHRDLRPSNIILRNFYNPDSDTEVVVLDFDLSWHRGAYEMSMTQHAQSALGYLAPEQTIKMTSVSTRNAAVDTYGLCATVYFLFTGEHPHQTLFHSADFDDHFRRKCAVAKSGNAESVGNRLRRLITVGLAWKQEARPDLGEIKQELQLLALAVREIENVESADFWAEELIARVQGKENYHYDDFKQEYKSSLYSGMEMSMGADFATNTVMVHLSFAGRGREDRKNVTKFLEERVPQAVLAMEKVGFLMDKGSEKTWSLSYSIRGRIKTSEIRKNLPKISETMQKSVQRLAIQ